MTPLDFQERIASQELQELINIHRLKMFTCEEPNPWTWKVWTKIQQEKDNLKTLMPYYSNPLLIPSFPTRGHSHNSNSNHQHHHHHNHDHSYHQIQNETSLDDDNESDNFNCQIL
jgi:hypothetical protein